MIVYKITNNVNGYGYIGITQCSMAKRWREHLCAARTGSGKRLYRAMRKYGTDNFTVVVLATAASFEELQALECRLIAEHNTHAAEGLGYNLTAGGEGRNRVDQLFGSQIYNAVLTEEIVEFIRSPNFWSVSNRDMLAKVTEAFGVRCAQDTLKDARNGASWTHLNAAVPPVKRGRGVRHDEVPLQTRAQQIATLAAHHSVAIAKSAELRRAKRQT